MRSVRNQKLVKTMSRRQILTQGAAAIPLFMVDASVGASNQWGKLEEGVGLDVDNFGRLDDGRLVRLVRLAQPGGITMEVCEFGGIVKSIKLAGCSQSLVLGYDTLDQYVADQRYVGGVVGRVANRIAGGRFVLDGREYIVSRNRDGDCLHGGFRGFNKRLWRIIGKSDESWPMVRMAYRSEDGEEGFPGQLDVIATFELPSTNCIRIAFEATTNRPTPVNLTHHFYFNLGAPREGTILDHELSIAASHFTPIDDGAIPTGEILPVVGTPLDLRTPRRLAEIIAADHSQIAAGRGLNHNWVLDQGARPALVLRSPESGIQMTVDTNQPGMQINSGHRLGPPFPKYGGLIVEPQHYPNSVNHSNFPDTILRPGNVYRATYSLWFARSR